MKRRAKLNVAYSRDLPKQKPAGFEMSGPGTTAEAQPDRKGRATPNPAQRAAGAAESDASASASYAGVKQVGKFLIVAAAAALSFYLVKRRLF